MLIEATRTCLRCNRPVIHASRIIDGRPVCPSCAPHFNPVARCPRCDRDAKIFGYDKVTGERVCNRCLTRLTHVTCTACGKYRRRAGDDPDGPKICRACAAEPGVSHRCPDCRTVVPGRGNARCGPCAIARRFEAASERLASELVTPWAKTLFRGFCRWGGFDRTQPDVVQELTRIADQIVDIEKRFVVPANLTQTALLEAYGVEGLRRRQLLVGYLTACCDVAWSESVAFEFNQRRRADAIVADASAAGHADEITRYEAWLSADLSPRTRVTYLRVARAFIAAQRGRDLATVDEARIMAFIRQNPGYRASLSSFTAYLREVHAAPIPSLSQRPVRTQRARDRTLVRRARLLRDALVNPSSNAAGRAALVALLGVLYQVPLEDVASLPSSAFRWIKGRLWLSCKQGDFRLTPEVAAYVETYAVLDNKGYAFPGRPATRPIHPVTISYHLPPEARQR